MPSVFFFILAASVLVAVHAYLLRSFARTWLPKPSQRWGLAGGITAGLFAVLSLRRLGIEHWAGEAFAWVAYLWMGAGLLFLTGALLVDAGRGITWLTDRALSRELNPEDASRRELLFGRAQALAGAGAVAGAAIGLAQARGAFDVTTTEIPLEGLPAAFDGYRIVQVSDIHVGPTIKGDFVKRIVDTINELKPDLVAITGDLVDGSLKHLSEHVAHLQKIQSRDGTYFVTGNHEYYSGAQTWVDYVRSLGITALMNEHRVIRRGEDAFVLAGVTDYTAHRHDPGHKSDVKAALQDAPDDLCKVLLAHQPRSVYEAVKAKVALQLSGHTHNGQLKPFNFLVALAQPYMKGLSPVKESKSPMWIYVHRGTGYWGPPNRLANAPEVALLQLRGGN